MKATLEFSDRYGLLGLIVRLWTGCWASHVEFITDDGQRFGAAPDGGVRLRPWTKPRRAERYTVDLPRYDTAMLFARDQSGQPYDWDALVGYALHRFTKHHHGWFCSELVAEVCWHGGATLCPGRDPAFTAPKHLLKSPLLTRVI